MPASPAPPSRTAQPPAAADPLSAAWHKSLGPVLALAGLGALVYALVFRHSAFAVLGPLRNLLGTLVASLPFALAARWALRTSASPRSQVLVVLAGTLALRLACPWGLIEGSDDAYRYLWDARVQSAGHNPYSFAPEAPELAPLRDPAVYTKVFRPDMRTVYPPLAQLMFRLGHLGAGSKPWGLKAVFLLHELASALLLCALLRRRSLPPAWALLYAWSPLAVVQTFVGSHLDAMLVPWLLLALHWSEKHPFASGLALGLSAMVRPLTLLGVWALALRRALGESAWFLMGCGLACVVLVLPYALGARWLMLESLGAYSRHWQFNGSIYQLLHPLLHSWGPFRATLYLLIALLALAMSISAGQRHHKLAAAFGSYFAFAPTVYPWYLLSIQALLALDRPSPLAIALPSLITLSDLVFVGGQVGAGWRVPPGALAVEYLGLYALLALHVLRARRELSAD